jgi:hypothetical protein
MLVSAYSLCPVRKPSGVNRVGSSLVRTLVDYVIEEDNANAMIGFVAETATFISECAEDENDSVVRETHRLKNAVESVAGSISGL